jgi:N-acylneuraminate cytidylyltransferase|tara:strand:- start:384 stop:980 length:597 start_codon:yes stop_codon:yes gene_type:complete
MYENDIRALAIIPAKTDSTRLKKKNLRVIAGKTLVEHALDYATNSELIKHIVVTTESDEVKELTKNYKVFVFDRDETYMGEREVADVYVNVTKEFKKDYENLFLEMTHVVGIQPDHPDRQTKADELLEYAVVNKYDDLVTVDSSGTRNGAVRVTKKKFVESGMMSRRVGSYLDDCTNIHSEEDLKSAENNIKRVKDGI